MEKGKKNVVYPVPDSPTFQGQNQALGSNFGVGQPPKVGSCGHDKK